jgi:signal recognition particle GTPase
MFDLLKKKIAGWLSSDKPADSKEVKAVVADTHKKVSDKKVEKKTPVKTQKQPQTISKLSSKKQPIIPEVVDDFDSVDLDEPSSEVSTDQPAAIPEKKGFFSKIKSVFSSQTITEEFFNDSFNDLEIILLEGNVAVSVVDFAPIGR